MALNMSLRSCSNLYARVCVGSAIRYAVSAAVHVFYLSSTANNSQDRRPITPPPCVRLIVRDATTKQEVEAEYVAI